MLELRNIFQGSGGTSVSVADMDFLQNSKKIIRTTGISKVNILTRDELLGSFIELLVNHAELIESCSLLIVVNQTKPFELPQVSNFILEHIGCKHNIECIDVNLGCTGFVYATTLADRLLHNNAECLILTGDAISSELEIDDFVNRPLFGDAAFLTHFIKINDNVNHLNLNVFNGSKSLYFNKHNSHFLNSAGFHMNGIEVFNFGIRKVSRVIKDFISLNKLNNYNIVLHQANRFMLESIMTKLKDFHLIGFYNDGELGNTGPSTIPDTILYNFDSLKGSSCIIVGFGVGLQISINIIKIQTSLK